MNDFLIIFIMLIFSAFFSGVETGVLSLSPLNIVRGKQSILVWLYRRREMLIVTMLVGNNITIVSSTMALQNILSKNQDIWTTIGGFTIQLIVFFLLAEALPKAVFRRGGIIFLGYVYPLILFFYYLFKPVSLFFFYFTTILVRLFPSRTALSRDEVIGFIGSNFVGDSQPIMEGFLLLEKTRAREIMTPLPEFISFDKDETISDITRIIDKANYSRYPVYEERGDNIIGYVNVRDFLEVPPSTKLSQILHPASFMPETLSAEKVRRRMQEDKLPILFTVNEYGSVVGLITFENIAEELTGDIVAHDQSHEEEDIKHLGNRGYRLGGNLDIDDFNDYFGFTIEKDGYETITGYLTQLTGRIPQKGETVSAPAGEFYIAEADPKTINTIIYKKHKVGE